jgi:type I restriction enzyme, S subunit
MLRWAYLPECNNPPSGWTVRCFTQVADVIAGQSPPSETYNSRREGLPFLQGNADFTEKYPKPSLWCSAPQRIAQRGDVLISVRAPVGEVNRADEEYAIGRGLAAIRATSSDGNFLYHALQRWRWSLQRVAQGTTFDAVTARHFAQLHVAIPDSPEEQAAIATILDAVDTVVQRTRNAIENVRELRDSLIHRFLRYGVKKGSQKKTEAGLIPSHWACEPLGLHIDRGPTNGLYRPESDYTAERGTPIVRIDSFAQGEIHDIPSLRRVNVQPAIEQRYSLSASDILINRVNSLSHIGKAAIVPRLIEPTIFESNIMALRCGKHLIPDFLILVLCSDIARKHWLSRAKPAVNQASINQRDVRELPIPLPKREEQRQIVDLAAAALAYLQNLEQVVAAQTKLKKSLMHDLLTGKVRVNNVNLNTLLDQ